MSPERLAHIKAHFLNPPSAACDAGLALELVAELERLAADKSFAETIKSDLKPGFSFDVGAVVIDDRASLPVHPEVEAEKKPKKKGKP